MEDNIKLTLSGNQALSTVLKILALQTLTNIRRTETDLEIIDHLAIAIDCANIVPSTVMKGS